MADPIAKAARETARRLREIYGADLAPATGVIHVAAVGRDRAGRLHTIAIGPGAPPSATDHFLLLTARARADAIVATGEILRREPDLVHEPLGDPGLAAWRRSALKKGQPPLSVVLTRGRALDLEHPLFRAATRAAIFTGATAARRLGPRPRPNVDVLGEPAPSLRKALARLRAELGCHTIDVEAGPSSTAELYEDPLAVDELMLSIYEEKPLPTALRAGRFTDEERLRAAFAEPAPPFVSHEESGRWSFHRFVRRPSRGAARGEGGNARRSHPRSHDRRSR
jgi:riboflavin biosynthesis pyrimidine reductase